MTTRSITKYFGGNGGSEFELESVQSIGLRTGSRLDQITINDVAHGGNGGSDQGVLTLSDGEYINKIRVRSGSEIDYLELFTNKGNSIGGGGDGGSSTLLEDIQVVAIGGRSGSRVDQLSIQYTTEVDHSKIVTTPFGGDGGSEFAKSIIQEIGLRTGSRVDQIRINGEAHGGNGGSDQGSITLSDDEYINKINVRSGSEVDYVEFSTNLNNTIGGGGSGGSQTLLEDIRVIAIGGRSGSRVDKLNIEYIDGYQPSSVVTKNVGFILSYTSPFQELYEYEDSHEKTVDSYEKITESMLNQTYTASVEGEYYVKVAASTQIEIKDSSLETVRNELQQELSSGSHKTITIEEGYVGVLLVNGTLMMSAEGDEYWMFPTADVSYSVIKIEDITNVQDHYDLTGELYTQMPGLIDYKEIKNGYTFYSR